MASKTTVQLIDDVDGSEAVETIEFGIDGAEYEIDLSNEHADALRTALSNFVTSARRTGQVGAGRSDMRVPRPAAKRRTVDPVGGFLTREERDSLRAWAGENGYRVSDRGRIGAEVREAWVAAGRPSE